MEEEDIQLVEQLISGEYDKCVDSDSIDCYVLPDDSYAMLR